MRKLCIECMEVNCTHVRRPPSLTERQMSILRRLSVDGPANKIIAYEMGISEGVVKLHLHKAAQRLSRIYPGVTNRTGLALWAARYLPATADKESQGDHNEKER